MEGNSFVYKKSASSCRYSKHLKNISQASKDCEDPFENIERLKLILSVIVQENYELTGSKHIPEDISFFTGWFFTVGVSLFMDKIPPRFNKLVATNWNSNRQIRDIELWSRATLDKAKANLNLVEECMRSLLHLGYVGQWQVYDFYDTGAKKEESGFGRYTVLYCKEADDKLSMLFKKVASVSRCVEFTYKLKGPLSLNQFLEECPDDVCAICADAKINETLDFTILDCCRHLFCTTCVNEWFQRKRICPRCREEVLFSVTSDTVKDILSSSL